MGRILDADSDESLRVSSASVTSELLLLGFRNTFITGVRPLNPDTHVIGGAFTLRYVPAREDRSFEVDYDNTSNVQRIAVETVGAGEVLVIDARREVGAASFGHILCTRLQARGVAGLVTDGAVRDSSAIKELGLPCYAAGGHATTSSVLHYPVDCNVPIACGGVMVEPGDLIVGDGEGVAVVPAQLAEEVLERARQRDHLERWIQGRVAVGASIRGVYPPDARTLEEYRAATGRSKVV